MKLMLSLDQPIFTARQNWTANELFWKPTTKLENRALVSYFAFQSYTDIVRCLPRVLSMC